ncbi:arylphorin subunit alpha-like [Hylaeus volcanicus]|uniref:arylphorin subunit alpha-like n=1 Tax=Hylaeus volcanicus TaxID=313075 RepID=UPI0023B831A7|nr:arylphorin subunit alpha-like [Hylaeus volcanicus]
MTDNEYKSDSAASIIALGFQFFTRYKMLRLWLLGLLAISFAQAAYYETRTADTDYLLKQKKVYNLLYHVSQPMVVNRDLYDEGQAWSIESNLNSYGNEAAKKFLSFYEKGMLPRGALFSVYYPKLLKELMALFDLFYYANDFDVFYKTALWARIYMNEGQYIYALYNAIIRRPDTKYIQLPPVYELYPNAFYNSEVLEKAHYPQIYGKMGPKSANYTTYFINANYSGWYLNREYNMENKLNYFVEDVGLNEYYFFFRQNFPFWQKSKEFGFPNYRGEEYLYGHKQLLNRYNLERLSNDLPKLEDFDWNKPFYPGYYPTMMFASGLPFTQRPYWSSFPYYKYKYIKDISDMESRLSAAIDSGFVLKSDGKWANIYTPEGLNILGNLIEGNADSYNRDFYGSIDYFGRKILGFNLEPANSYQLVPSSLEMFSTSLRDPAFYRLYKRVLDYYYRYSMLQKPYTKDEIVYPNLKIQSFAVDKLITYFDQYDASISNGLMVQDDTEAETLLVKVRQYRLNHKPFNFHIAVTADKPMKAAFRIFLGPAFNSNRKYADFEENFKYFYEMDNWFVDLNAGPNKITRNSKDCFFLSSDPEPSELYYQKIQRSLNYSEPFTYYERISGFPERLLLPKGKKEGMPFQLFLYISPVSQERQYFSRIWGNYMFDNNPYGFPLDKPIYDFAYDGPNMMFKNIFIYHKDDYDMNIPY